MSAFPDSFLLYRIHGARARAKSGFAGVDPAWCRVREEKNMNYSERVIADLKSRYADQPEFIQAASEVLTTLQPALDAHPEYEEAGLLERLVEPERIVIFRVPWVDDQGKVQVNYKRRNAKHFFNNFK